MELGLLNPASITFEGYDLGKFDKETEVLLTMNDILKTYTTTTSQQPLDRKTVRKEVKLKVTTKWSDNYYQAFLTTINSLNPKGVIVIDSSELNITIQNMSLSGNGKQSFGGKGGFDLEFICLDRIPSINIIEK